MIISSFSYYHLSLMQFYNVKLLIYSKLDLALYYMVPSTQLRVASAAIVITICILGYTAK